MRVLTVIDYYIPGYRFGGPLRTIANMVENLGDEIEFLIVTRDRDFGINVPYANIQIDAWNIVGKARVFYCSPSMFSFYGMQRLLSETTYDVLYLNSFLSPKATGLPLLIQRLGLSKRRPIIIAPRGELSPGALRLKATKKKLYIFATGLFRFYRNLVWQASSDSEAGDIRHALGWVAGDINVAPNVGLLLAPDLLPLSKIGYSTQLGFERIPGVLRVIFLSRIAPIKNLDFLLRILGKVNGNVELSICGPKVDLDHWNYCQMLINVLPSNVSVQYVGEVVPDNVRDNFAKNDVFVFPTKGENFGHVIFESLWSGTSVILSDKTPWKSDGSGAVEVLPLEEPDLWVSAVERWSKFDQGQFVVQRKRAFTYAKEYMATSPALEQNRQLFRFAAKQLDES